jgi:hypothetical protein
MESENFIRNDTDLKFLKELRKHLEKWSDKNDWSERDYAFKIVDDWIDKLKQKVK